MQFDPERITFFAKTDARGQHVQFGIKAKDRTRHVYVIGKTGMGKSTLLENMAVQDIQNGEGIAFIDPHGSTAETILTYVPEHRKKDVLYFAPFDTAYPVAFNVMEDVGPERRHLVVSGLMSVFKKIWVDAWSARMEYILQNTLMALLEYPDSTLLGVNRMLSDKGYRQKVVDNIKDPAVKSFWVDEFANYNERYMQEAGDAIKNKIGQFTANPLIRNIIGQPKSSFDIRKMMDERKIIIMNLSKGLVGESNANLLGSMLTTRIYLAAMSRADLTPQQMQQAPNFYFYVDEFQSFANATFADILSEARKYKLNLTIAHQYIEQMEEEVRNAVFGNVGTIISFRVGPFDAEVLETIFSPQFMAVDIVNLGFAQIYLSLMIDGIGSRPFSATTLPPIAPPQISYRDVVAQASRDQFAQPRATVEERINAWHSEVHEQPKKSGAGNGGGKGKPAPGGGNGARPEVRPPREREREPASVHGASNINTAPHKDAPESVAQKPREERRPQSNGAGNGGGNTGASRQGNRKSEPARTADVASLREVLKNIATETSKRDEVPNQKSSTEPVTQTKDSPLRAALADVLKQTTPPATTAPAPSGTAPQHAPETAPREAAIQPTPAPAVPPPPAPPNGTPQHERHDDPLDPKKIERMLRVHRSDRSPLR
jgi:energy-coupling factor transporter ATP-binding protein EcfA2